MGLDMYLYKTKKVDGFTAKDYSTAEKILDYFHEKELAKQKKEDFNYSFWRMGWWLYENDARRG